MRVLQAKVVAEGTRDGLRLRIRTASGEELAVPLGAEDAAELATQIKALKPRKSRKA